MSEKRKEIEEEEEEEEEVKTLNHWVHIHPLTLAKTSKGGDCYGCGRRCSSGDQAYGCSTKDWWCDHILLHEECAEMARKIRHPVHPQHTLIQQAYRGMLEDCAVCHGFKSSVGYECTSSECKFEMHMACAQGSGTIEAADDDDDDDDKEQSRSLRHPSHPAHELRLLERRSSFKCDACGTKRGGKSYICSACEYWIHERCATLPETMKREDHHHPLSLSFHVPPHYMKFNYRCEVCNKYLLPRYWIYHCELCGYAVHLKCAFKTAKRNAVSYHEKDIIRLPINDVVDDQIRPFVTRERGGIAPIPHGGDDKYKFLHHEHELSLISSPSSHHDPHHQNEDEDEEDDQERSEIICDGCITPIFSPSLSSSSSSSSSSEKSYYYMSCSECKYYLHWPCFNLPPQLPSLPLHNKPDHELVLESCPKLTLVWYCFVCHLYSNGLFYTCRQCHFKADVKCASLLPIVHHEAHPQHLLAYVGMEDLSFPRLLCAADCEYPSLHYSSYACRGCEFLLHVKCALLPPSVRSDTWDRQHVLPLTRNANLNHRGEFYCDECEAEMNPKSWMYHCRRCDLSFHPHCFRTASGYYRNVKFGGKYTNDVAHHHPLAYQLLTSKRKCDVCLNDMYNETGFHCPSCNFFVCYFFCNEEMFKKGNIQAID